MTLKSTTPHLSLGSLVVQPSRHELDEITARTQALWEELRGGRLFLTGGTGFFGCWLLESFIHANRELELEAEIVVLSRDPAAFQVRAPGLASAECVSFLNGDITGFSFPKSRFTHVIHAASDLSVARPKDPLGLIDTTLRGTRRVLDFARESGASKLLFTSSGAVYGPMMTGRDKIKEDSPISRLPLEPRGAYGEAKRLAELICTIFGHEHGIEIKIARGFAFLGPYLALDSHLAAAEFLRSALRGDPILIQGHGRTVRSYLYGADLAVWLWTILFKGIAARPYNVGSDAPVTIAGLAEAVASATELPLEVRILGQLRPDETVDKYVPDINRARIELSLDVYTSFPEAIRRTLNAYYASKAKA